jgi:hypothetical protein
VTNEDERADRVTDAVSVGLLTMVFPPSLVDEVIDETDAREVRRRALPARLTLYVTLAMWLYVGTGSVRVLRDLLAGLRAARGGYGDGDRAARRVDLQGPCPAGTSPAARAVRADRRPGRHPVRPGCSGGRRVVATDGTVVDLPDTAEKVTEFATPAGGAYRTIVLHPLQPKNDHLRKGHWGLDSGTSIAIGRSCSVTIMVSPAAARWITAFDGRWRGDRFAGPARYRGTDELSRQEITS